MYKFTKVFSVLETLVGLTAVVGGIFLIFNNGLGMSTEQLKGSMFESFFWPGFILSVVVGGTHLFAGWGLYKQSPFRFELLATAGFGLLIWVFTEMYIISTNHWLQIVYFAWGILTLIATMVFLEHKRCTLGV